MNCLVSSFYSPFAISVFAYVGGTYFFFKAVLNFSVHCVRVLCAWLIRNLKQKTRRNINRIHTLTMSMSTNKMKYRMNEEGEERSELLKDMSSESDEEEKEPITNNELPTGE